MICDVSQNHKMDPNHKINKINSNHKKINKWTNYKVDRNQIFILIKIQLSKIFKQNPPHCFNNYH